MTIETDLFRLGLDFERLTETSKSLRGQSELFRSQAKQTLEEFKRLRILRLEEILAEKKLGICLFCHHDSSDLRLESRNELGIYPLSKLKLYFHTRNQSYPDLGDFLALLCPEHISQMGKDEVKYVDGEKEISTRVVEKDGKLIAVADSSEITIPVEKEYFKKIFKHFNIPELPEIDESVFGSFGELVMKFPLRK